MSEAPNAKPALTPLDGALAQLLAQVQPLIQRETLATSAAVGRVPQANVASWQAGVGRTSTDDNEIFQAAEDSGVARDDHADVGEAAQGARQSSRDGSKSPNLHEIRDFRRRKKNPHRLAPPAEKQTVVLANHLGSSGALP